MRRLLKTPFLQCNNETDRTRISVAVARHLSTILSVQAAVDGELVEQPGHHLSGYPTLGNHQGALRLSCACSVGMIGGPF